MPGGADSRTSPTLLELVREPLQDRVRAEVDLEPVGIESLGLELAGERDQLGDPVEPAAPEHQPLANPAQKQLRDRLALLAGGDHRLTRRIARLDPALGPEPGIERHPRFDGDVRPDASVAGTLAGDDTILIIARDPKSAQAVVKKLGDLAR